MNTSPIVRADRFAGRLIERYSLPFLRWSLVIVLIWSGVLAIADMSSGTVLLAESMGVPVGTGVVVLGAWEIAAGLGLAHDRTVGLGVWLVVGYVAVTMIPLIAMQSVTFLEFPLTPTFEGVYNVKNWVLLGGAITVGGTVD